MSEEKITPENEYGNVEYKLKLLNKDNKRLEELSTQMRYRCNQSGIGECIYNLGVFDDGRVEGITEKEYEETIDNLKKIATDNDYSVNILTKKKLKNNKYIYEILIREINDDKYIDIKVAIAGNVNAGKSSFLGSLISGKKDNGRGLSRMSVFNYIHEIKTGRTSSVAQHILGYDNEGEIVNYQEMGKKSWSDIVKRSSKIISFYDLAGHEKYLKTTILGFTSSVPDICMIVIASNDGIMRMTKEHLFLCLSLNIPFVIIITKVDLCVDRKNILSETISKIKKKLKYPGIRKIPVLVNNKEDIILSAKNIYSDSIVPIFKVSNVTGEGLNNVKEFLNILNKSDKSKKEKINKKVEYHICNIFSVTGVGTVLGGNLIKGKISIGDKLYLGPVNNEYRKVTIKSIHCKRVPVQSVDNNCYVCLGIQKFDKRYIRKGAVLVSDEKQKIFISEFKAEVSVLKSHSTTIRIGYEPVMYCNSIRQCVKILNIENKKNGRKSKNKNDDILRTGDRALVTFRFKYKCEFLKEKSKILLAEGRTKVIGVIKKIL